MLGKIYITVYYIKNYTFKILYHILGIMLKSNKCEFWKLTFQKTYMTTLAFSYTHCQQKSQIPITKKSNRFYSHRVLHQTYTYKLKCYQVHKKLKHSQRNSREHLPTIERVTLGRDTWTLTLAKLGSSVRRHLRRSTCRVVG